MGANLTGKTLGDFQIDSMLGRGSMAKVYKARQISLRRPVALKVLEEGIFTPGDNIKRFLREAEAMARLEHPHIVPVYAAGEDHPYYFFAMRLMQGGSLADAMKKGVTRSQAVDWACRICQALAYAHTAKVIHRDLKPKNVLIQDDVPFLADFGLARLKDMSTITQRGFPVGTPLYMSPEQTRGEEAGAPSDCFALGIILYQMLAGSHPFIEPAREGTTKVEARVRLFDRIQTGKFLPLKDADPEITPLLVNVIDRSLARDPLDRYPDGAAMLRDLDEARKMLKTEDRLVRVSSAEEFGSSAKAAADAAKDDSTPRSERDTATQALPPPRPGPTPIFCFGRYEVLREIGHGGQGVVYEAHDPVLDRKVALKVVQKGWAEDSHVRDQFWHEARVAARMIHPHIISIYDFGVERQCPYLTMPFIEGSSLDRMLEDGKPLSAKFALQVLRQVAEALEFAHENDVIHLDVKPGNILIQQAKPRVPKKPVAMPMREPPPFVLLTDFTMAQFRQAQADEAAAKAGASGTGVGFAAGTIAYSAPEVLNDDLGEPSPASDIFSLGVVFHEMLTGKRLFKSDTRSLTQIMVLKGQVTPLSAERSDLPQGVDEFCQRMLHTEPDKRISSAGSVVSGALRLMRGLRG